MRTIVLICALSWSAEVAAATFAPLAAEALAARVSLKLRGHLPSAEESAAFVDAWRAHPENFMPAYNQLIDTALASEAFGDVVEQIHGIAWRIPRAESTRLARIVITGDRPYSEILAHDYVILNAQRARAYGMVQARTEESLQTVSLAWTPLRLAADERRFRSVLSHLDFLNAFPDTPTNKNRKRANALASGFLCQAISPTTPLADRPVTSDPHGTDPACVGCHYRVDPLARFFDQWRPPTNDKVPSTWFDATQVARGNLILPNDDGTYTQYPGADPEDLADHLLQEPRYWDCVVHQAWSYLMGPAVTLDATTGSAYRSAFMEHRNYKWLIHAMLLHPYFWSTDEPKPLQFADVKASFAVCVGCHHRDGAIHPQFDPVNYPFIVDANANASLLQRIWGAVNHASGVKAMPPAPIPPLPPEHVARIAAWIEAGAHDDRLQPTLQSAQIAEILGE